MKLHVGTEIHVRQPLQELRGAALGDASMAVHDEVLLQAGRVELRSLERDDDARVALDVADLLVQRQVACHELVSVEPDPDARHLRGPVLVERDEMGQRA